jgi:hypothetical protein
MYDQDEKDNEFLRRQPDTLNPYLLAAAMVAKRLVWDLHPNSWVSRSRIKKWKNRHEGKKAVILCNGPSLLNSDLSLLEDTFTFGLNKINMLFDKNDFRPSCIVAVNRYVIEQNKDFYNQTEIPLFLNNLGIRHVRPRKNVIFMSDTSQRRFAKDCSMSVYHSHTVTFVALELAFHMGFGEVALIGADHNFATSGPSNKLATAGDHDPNHFDPKYFSGGVKWELPDLFESEVGYMMARRMYDAYGRRVINCTAGGKLEIFPRMALEDFVAA